LFPFVSETSK